jgi:Fe-S-cluster-containing hydrogenase component 2
LFAFEPEGWRKISVLQDSDRCNGCAKCAVKCPLNVIAMEKQTAGLTWTGYPNIRQGVETGLL